MATETDLTNLADENSQQWRDLRNSRPFQRSIANFRGMWETTFDQSLGLDTSDEVVSQVLRGLILLFGSIDMDYIEERTTSGFLQMIQHYFGSDEAFEGYLSEQATFAAKFRQTASSILQDFQNLEVKEFGDVPSVKKWIRDSVSNHTASILKKTINNEQDKRKFLPRETTPE